LCSEGRGKKGKRKLGGLVWDIFLVQHMLDFIRVLLDQKQTEERKSVIESLRRTHLYDTTREEREGGDEAREREVKEDRGSLCI